MIGLLSRIAFFKISRAIKSIKTLPISLAFSVTGRCNLSCKTCGIWSSKPEEELSLCEYRDIFSSIKGRIFWLTFDGGEPFLRHDFKEILRSACHLLNPRVVNIATNGTLPEAIYGSIREIVSDFPATQFVVNLSIDGIEGRHDYIRGKAGSFSKVKGTFDKLKTINEDNFSLGINTTVSVYNADHLPDILRYCIELGPDSYLMELAGERDMFRNFGSGVCLDQKKSIDALKFMLKESGRFRGKRFSALTRIMRSRYYDLARGVIERQKRTIPCLGGTAFGHVFSNGDIWCCSVKKRVMGNLKEAGYDFKKVWHSSQSNRLRREISSGSCFCVSANAAYSNMLCRVCFLPRLANNYLLWKIGYFK